MQEKLLAEFPDVAYEAWREQVQKDLKGADFEKRLVTRTLEGVAIQPLYTRQDAPNEQDPSGFAGLPPYRRGAVSVGNYGPRWDLRAEHRALSLQQAKADITDDLARGATSLWLRFDALARLGVELADAQTSTAAPDGLPCASSADLDTLLGDVDLDRVGLSLDAGGNAPVLAAALCAMLERHGRALSTLHGSLGCDALGALARDGVLPHSLEQARSLLVELVAHVGPQAPALRVAQVSTLVYHDAGASAAQEVGYALATGLEYLRWLLDGGVSIGLASQSIGFSVGVSCDLFLELAKLRALRLCWAKVVAAYGGDAAAQNTQLHAVTSLRTQTQRDPWVNMLRTTTEAFSAMVAGVDALTTRGFDEALGVSEPFARRIARNTQIILNEEAHVTRVADAGGGSYYIESLTDGLARSAWRLFQEVERRGGMSTALVSGAIAKDVAELADKRAAAVAKRSSAITGVSEFAHLGEEPVLRQAPDATATRSEQKRRLEAAAQPAVGTLLAQLEAAAPGQRISAAIQAARQAASLDQLTRALAAATAAARCVALPLRRQAEPFEALRSRCERHAAHKGQRPTAFLCNLGAIPQHKARASFSLGFLSAGGVAVIDNDGFASLEAAVEAFAASGTTLAVICGSDEQYPEWVPKLAGALRARGATHVVLAGRPGEHEVAYQQAGVSQFIFLGLDVVATLTQLLDSLGVAP
jgi:methylmalonyl-CoA mutase